ncbi:hypothetical protein Pint_25833 [Pistacia integerrima]|uniref:Uncharacterized protein n=1 Tax=Pistacia integerrima TaxID=434235 RepID=A0ACC0YA58_9ROSI|nr:hypothetical protein Pint_25833 [Pistacia integerrima]
MPLPPHRRTVALPSLLPSQPATFEVPLQQPHPKPAPPPFLCCRKHHHQPPQNPLANNNSRDACAHGEGHCTSSPRICHSRPLAPPVNHTA